MTTLHDDGGPIAPSMIMRQQVAADTFAESRMDAEGGLTLRDWFAGMALQGAWATLRHEEDDGELYSFSASWYQFLAMHAYEMADAMLAARKEDA